MKYVVRGTIAPHGGNDLLVGQFTYLCESSEGWCQWDGWHKVTRFATQAGALAAAAECSGPLFRKPDPASIVTIEIEQEAAA